MYNLNVNVATGGSANLLAVGDGCTTPKTPEILNSLIAMTNPLDGYSYPTLGGRAMIPRLSACTPSSDTSSSSGSGAGSPLGSPVTPSIQHTCSQLIKEGLKLTIQSKRRNTGRSGDTDMDSNGSKMPKREEVSLCDDDYGGLFSPGTGLTAEDEERRRRRRERNKIAATKCRLKKRERTVNLVQESEILETQNHDLKTQIQELEAQRRRLMDTLSMHGPTCMKSSSQGPAAATPYCGDSPVQGGTYCEPQTTYQHHYASTSCNFNGGYSSSGVDSGCMA